MLATLETIKILEKAEELAIQVMQSDIGEDYLISFYKLANDHEAQQKIRKFNSMKELYEEVQRFGRYHPEYKSINLNIREAKREMDLHPTIADFKKAETELQAILDEISVKLGQSVSPNIKVPTGNPFFETSSSCSSGGCGSGGSCSCSA